MHETLNLKEGSRYFDLGKRPIQMPAVASCHSNFGSGGCLGHEITSLSARLILSAHG